jgi:hypothetical protein
MLPAVVELCGDLSMPKSNIFKLVCYCVEKGEIVCRLQSFPVSRFPRFPETIIYRSTRARVARQWPVSGNLRKPETMAASVHDAVAISWPIMSNTDIIAERDAKTGQFLKGFKGGPGRKLGSRSKLNEQTLQYLNTVLAEDASIGKLRELRDNDPGTFFKIVASLLPKEAVLDVDISVRQATDALSAYRVLKSLPAAELRRLHREESDDADNNA